MRRRRSPRSIIFAKRWRFVPAGSLPHASRPNSSPNSTLWPRLRAPSFDERVRFNQEFHLTIAEASGSKRLLAMIRGLREYFLNPRWVSRRESKLFRRAVEDHKKIVAALRARSPERIERALRSHLKIGWDELMSGAQPRRG
jgi:DNA-binding GntR family transcriptional regulator